MDHHGRGNGGEGALWAKLLAVLLGFLLWWLLVPSASEQTPLGASEQQVDDFAEEDPASEPTCTSAPAHPPEPFWTCIDFLACEHPCVSAGHERFERERGPPMA